MVQVLPGVPSFGGQLAQVLSEAGGKVAQGYQQYTARTALEKLFNPSGATATGGAQGSSQPGDPSALPVTPTSQAAPSDPFKNPGTMVSAYNLLKQGYGEDTANVAFQVLSNQQKEAAKDARAIAGETRKRQNDISQKKQEQDIGKLSTIQEQRRNLNLARTAVQSGDVGAFSLNSFADMFGEAGKRLKTASGAQLDTATKNLLFETLNKVTAKGTNLWLEKVAKSATPELGKSKAANETLITMALGALDIEEKQLEIQDMLSQQYLQAGLAVPANIEKLTNDLLKPYAEQIENQMAYDTRVIFEEEKGQNYLNNLEAVPEGTPLTAEKAQALVKKFNGDQEKAFNTAKKLGYKIMANPASGK